MTRPELMEKMAHLLEKLTLCDVSESEDRRHIDRLTDKAKDLLAELHKIEDAEGGKITHRAQLDTLIREVMEWHREPSSLEYNQCEDNPCSWCEAAAEALNQMQTLEAENAQRSATGGNENDHE